jgi:hypothetical protein
MEFRSLVDSGPVKDVCIASTSHWVAMRKFVVKTKEVECLILPRGGDCASARVRIDIRCEVNWREGVKNCLHNSRISILEYLREEFPNIEAKNAETQPEPGLVTD